MEQCPFWEANRIAASQEIPLILRNPKVRNRIHKSKHYETKDSMPSTAYQQSTAL